MVQYGAVWYSVLQGVAVGSYTLALHRAVLLVHTYMGWLRLVGPLQTYVSFAKKPYKTEDILQKRPMFLRSLLIFRL